MLRAGNTARVLRVGLRGRCGRIMEQHKVLAAQQAKHPLLYSGEGRGAGRDIHSLESLYRILDAVKENAAAVRGDDVSVPVDVGAVGAVELRVSAERSRDPSAERACERGSRATSAAARDAAGQSVESVLEKLSESHASEITPLLASSAGQFRRSASRRPGGRVS